MGKPRWGYSYHADPLSCVGLTPAGLHKNILLNKNLSIVVPRLPVLAKPGERLGLGSKSL